MKKLSIVLLCAVIIGGGFFGAKKALALASYFTINQSATATTTVSYMTPGTATTTYSLTGGLGTLNSDVDANAVFVIFTASTSVATLDWKIQYSNDNSNWFDEPSMTPVSNGNTILEASSSPQHVWEPGNATASTTGKVIVIQPIPSLYKRIVFSIPIGGIGGAVWIQDTAKRNTSGQ